MGDVTSDRHLQTAGQSLEDTFYLVVLVLPLGFDVQVHLRGIAEALEEMEEHLRGHLANLLPFELRIPDEPWTSAKVKRHLAEAVVHGQTEAVALYAALVA